MLNFCTLFDSNYLSRGLALYESLCKYSNGFHIFIFTFDDISNKIVKSLELKYATVIGLEEFEDNELLAIKPSRSRLEYFWTCTPSIIKFVLDNYNVNSCTYLDADIYFWDSPDSLIEEMKNSSVLITKHHYTRNLDNSKKSGIYCVQFMTFRNDKEGRLVLGWWQEACNKWCYDRFEDGKFGDQKYLDDWPQRFRGIHILSNLGGGIAPWNIQQYELFRQGEKLFGKNLDTGEDVKIVFYHFHNLQFYAGKVDLGGYRISKEAKSLIYLPYIKHVNKINTRLGIIGEFKKIHEHNKLRDRDLKMFLKYIKHCLMFNVISLKALEEPIQKY